MRKLIIGALLLLAATRVHAKELSAKQYSKEVHAIVAEDMKTLNILQRDPSVDPEAKAVAVNLIIADGYIVLRELDKLKHSFSTRAIVDKKLAQMSRDMESLDNIPLYFPTVKQH